MSLSGFGMFYEADKEEESSSSEDEEADQPNPAEAKAAKPLKKKKPKLSKKVAEMIMEALNGDTFTTNEAGEQESYRETERVVVGSDIPGVNDNLPFILDPADLTADNSDQIQLDIKHTSLFLLDQFAYLRIHCKIGPEKISDKALIELCLFRYLGYKNRIICCNFDKDAHHVKYNDAEKVDITDPTTCLSLVRGHDSYEEYASFVILWMSESTTLISDLTISFANIVCTVAYIFRQKGNHYIDGSEYTEAYDKLWEKIKRGGDKLTAKWCDIATIGLHAVIPCVLDRYWQSQAIKMRLSAPLTIRVNVAAAGTAAIFALVVGWEDARKVYHDLLFDQEANFKELKELVATCTKNRWKHAINAKYYGESGERLELAKYSALSATVYGVYQGAAPGATLLGAKSLLREASGAPLQKDISTQAAKYLKKNYVYVVQNLGKKVPAIKEK